MIALQAPPLESQRCHWNEYFAFGPVHRPGSPVKVFPTIAAPPIDGGVVFTGGRLPQPEAAPPPAVAVAARARTPTKRRKIARRRRRIPSLSAAFTDSLPHVRLRAQSFVSAVSVPCGCGSSDNQPASLQLSTTPHLEESFRCGPA